MGNIRTSGHYGTVMPATYGVAHIVIKWETQGKHLGTTKAWDGPYGHGVVKMKESWAFALPVLYCVERLIWMMYEVDLGSYMWAFYRLVHASYILWNLDKCLVVS